MSKSTKMDVSPKNNTGKYVSAASAMVALSAFVPNPNGALAQTPTATFTASATVVDAVGITDLQAIDFGKFVAGGTGRVIVSTAGVQSDTGANVTGLDAAQNGILRFSAAPTGTTNTLELSVPDIVGGITLVGTNNATQTMQITKLTFAADSAITKVNNVASSGTFVLESTDPHATIRFADSTGFPQDVAFGGRLVVGGTEESQQYTGTFDVLITFP